MTFCGDVGRNTNTSAHAQIPKTISKSSSNQNQTSRTTCYGHQTFSRQCGSVQSTGKIHPYSQTVICTCIQHFVGGKSAVQYSADLSRHPQCGRHVSDWLPFFLVHKYASTKTLGILKQSIVHVCVSWDAEESTTSFPYILINRFC